MSDIVIVINTGSATLKFAVFGVTESGALGEAIYRGLAEHTQTERKLTVRNATGAEQQSLERFGVSGDAMDSAATLAWVLTWLDDNCAGSRILAFGHRVVHGGDTFRAPVWVDEATLVALDRLTPLAPLHQPHNLDAIRTLMKLREGVPQIACFDTAFHHTQPRVAQMFGLPSTYFEQGVKRYGFHGLSYEYIAEVLPEVLGARPHTRVIVAHLGSGASMCAMHNRLSVATTMGFTALDGLLMGTRPGTIDPGVILYLLDTLGMNSKEVAELLYRKSGLLGVSGLSSDMRELLASDSPRAAEAIELFVYRVVRDMGSLVAALGGCDAVVFTGGVGERSPLIRQRICRGMAWLGLRLDAGANAINAACITEKRSRISAWVIATDEERIIARQALSLLHLSRRL